MEKKSVKTSHGILTHLDLGCLCKRGEEGCFYRASLELLGHREAKFYPAQGKHGLIPGPDVDTSLVRDLEPVLQEALELVPIFSLEYALTRKRIFVEFVNQIQSMSLDLQLLMSRVTF